MVRAPCFLCKGYGFDPWLGFPQAVWVQPKKKKKRKKERKRRKERTRLKIIRYWGFPGGTVVKNPPANAGHMGSIPGLGRSHMPRSNHNKRSHHDEKLAHRNKGPTQPKK